MREFEYDVFISYARDDIKAIEELHKFSWTIEFCKKLKARLGLSTSKKLEIFLDDNNMLLGDKISDKLKEDIQSSKFFIPLLSPNYFNSRWCREELSYFLEIQPNEKQTRYIIPLILSPYEDLSWNDSEKELIKQVEKHLFGKACDAKGKVFQPNSNDFYKLLDKVEKKIKDCDRRKQLKFFLGIAPSLSQKVRDELKHAFNGVRRTYKDKGLDLTLLPDDEISIAQLKEKGENKKDFEAAVQDYLKHSNFSIHLFDSSFGPRLTDTEESLLDVQFDQARKSVEANPLFCSYLICRNFDEETPKRFDAIEEAVQKYARIEKIPFDDGTDLEDLLGRIIENYIAKSESTDQNNEIESKNEDLNPSVGNNVFLISHSKDDETTVQEYKQHISKRNLTASDADFADLFYENDKNERFIHSYLKKAGKALILYSKGDYNWYQGMKIHLLRYYEDKKLPAKDHAAVLILLPQVKEKLEKAKNRVKFPFRVINCTNRNHKHDLDDFLS